MFLVKSDTARIGNTYILFIQILITYLSCCPVSHLYHAWKIPSDGSSKPSSSENMHTFVKQVMERVKKDKFAEEIEDYDKRHSVR